MIRTFALCGLLALVSFSGATAQGVPTQPQSPAKPMAPVSRPPRDSANKTGARSAPRQETSKTEGTKEAAPAPQPVAPAQQPIAPQSAREPTGEFQPVVQARAAKITTCMDKIVSMSARVIDRPHAAVSTYVQAAPDENVFEAIIGMNYPNKEMPNGAAVILAAPMNGPKCEGETIQIYPTTNSCTAVQASLIKNGRTLTSLNSLPLLQTKDGSRNLLIPTAGGGCVVIGITLH
jgi:hypothetical protein